MSRVRKLGINLFRIVMTLGFLWLAYNLIRFDDQYEIRIGAEILLVDTVQEKETNYLLTLPNQEARTVPKEGTQVTLQPGFISLFNQMNKTLYFALIPLFFLAFFFLSLRWKFLLGATRFDVSLWRVFLINYVGTFFNNFLPGSIGGDIARGLIAAKGEDRKAALVGTILLDRLIGLGVMILMATVCVIPFYNDASMRIPFLIVLCLFAGMMTSYFIYFSRTLRGLIPSSGNFGRVRHIFSELDSAFLLVNDQKRVVWLSILVSLIGQGILIILVYGLARSLSINEASLLQFFIFEPLIFIITALPISVGGWGIQEGAFAFFFGKAGVPANSAVAISILFKLTLILVSIPGGILMAFGLQRRLKAPEGSSSIEREGAH